jgi:hypothetical protein
MHHASMSKNHKNAPYVILTPPLAGEESNKLNMFQMRMHSYEFEILPHMGQNDISRHTMWCIPAEKAG